jgi:hypothetical protein
MVRRMIASTVNQGRVCASYFVLYLIIGRCH